MHLSLNNFMLKKKKHFSHWIYALLTILKCGVSNYFLSYNKQVFVIPSGKFTKLFDMYAILNYFINIP